MGMLYLFTLCHIQLYNFERDSYRRTEAKNLAAYLDKLFFNFCHIQCLLDKNENRKCILEQWGHEKEEVREYAVCLTLL
jgi:hypothetical protein